MYFCACMFPVISGDLYSKHDISNEGSSASIGAHGEMRNSRSEIEMAAEGSSAFFGGETAHGHLSTGID